MAVSLKAIKDYGWDHITLSTKGYKGAVHGFQTDKGTKIYLAFSSTDAFIVKDDEGLFGKDDLVNGIVKEKSIDIESSGSIEGSHALAWCDEDTTEIGYDEEGLTELGLNDFSVKEDLKVRLLKLNALTILEAIPQG